MRQHSQIIIMLTLRLLRQFANYRYFREIADFMKIKVPLINSEIDLENEQICHVYGIKRIITTPQLPEEVEQTEPTTTENEQESKASENVQTQESFIYQQQAETPLKFNQALEIAKTLELDLCLIRQGSQEKQPILSVSAVCRQIYRQYYQKHLKKKGKNGFKTIKLSDRINPNDLLNKLKNLKRMHNQGERKFRIEANNDSEKAEKVIKEFARMCGKKADPYLKAFKIPPTYKVEQRWICNLNFEDEVFVDPQRVNKKWRRRKYDEEKAQKDDSEEQIDSFENDSLEMQKELYAAYKQLGMKMPSKYQKAADLQKAIQTDKFALFRDIEEDPYGKDVEFQWDEEEQKRFAEKQSKYNSQFFGLRSIQEIVTQMQELKNSGYESQAYKVARYRQLKAELDLHLKKDRFDL